MRAIITSLALISAAPTFAAESDNPGMWARQASCGDVIRSVASPSEGWKWIAALAWAQGYQFGHAVGMDGDGVVHDEKTFAMAVMMKCRDNPGMDLTEAVVRVYLSPGWEK